MIRAPRRPVAAFLGLVIAAGVLAGAAPATTATPAAPATIATGADPLRIMPLGDSITNGGGHTELGGYRPDLWQLMKSDKRAVEFVGFRGTEALARLDGHGHHQGHPGYRIDQIDRVLKCEGAEAKDCPLKDGARLRPLETTKPDVVLLHVGTNDLGQNYELDSAGDRLGTLIDTITTRVPNAQVFVATVIPIDTTIERQVGPTAVSDFNAKVRAVVQDVAGHGRRVALVPMFPALGLADLADGVHPDNGGYAKMAARWYGALTTPGLQRVEAEAVANTVYDARIVKTAVASSGRKVGNLDNPGSYVELAVEPPGDADGWHRMYVRGGNGSAAGGTCTHHLTVNGEEYPDVSYPNLGWQQWTVAAVDVRLRAGRNAVRFTHGTCQAEIDSVDFAWDPDPAFTIRSGQTYRLTNANSGHCLDASGDTADTFGLRQWSCSNFGTQDWRLDGTDGVYTLVNRASGLCLGVPGGSDAAGRAPQRGACDGTDVKRWQVDPAGPAFYWIRSVASGLCLDIEDQSTSPGAGPLLSTCDNRRAQAWRLDRSWV